MCFTKQPTAIVSVFVPHPSGVQFSCIEFCVDVERINLVFGTILSQLQPIDEYFDAVEGCSTHVYRIDRLHVRDCLRMLQSIIPYAQSTQPEYTESTAVRFVSLLHRIHESSVEDNDRNLRLSLDVEFMYA